MATPTPPLTRCAAPRDAFKGIKLRRLPRVLTIGLKRFDFDLSTLTRVKLHHRVAIPRRLDVAQYLAGGAVARQHSQKRKQMGGGTPGGTPYAGGGSAGAAAAAAAAAAVPPLQQHRRPTSACPP